MKKILIPVLLLFVTQAAEADCLSRREARREWPGKYLRWRDDHCWFPRGKEQWYEQQKRKAPKAEPSAEPIPLPAPTPEPTPELTAEALIDAFLRRPAEEPPIADRLNDAIDKVEQVKPAPLPITERDLTPYTIAAIVFMVLWAIGIAFLTGARLWIGDLLRNTVLRATSRF